MELSLAALTGEIRPFQYFRQDVPPAIEAVIARCLRKIPEERYADAKALGEALLLAYSDEPLPESNTAATLTRSAPRSASHLAAEPGVSRDPEGTALTIVTPPRPDFYAPPPSSFSIAEAGASTEDEAGPRFDSGIALSCAILFLLSAVAWRHSHHRVAAQPIEPAAVLPVVTVATPPPPPVEVATAILTAAPEPAPETRL